MNYLDRLRRESHREGVTTGMWIGCCIGVALMIGVHLALSMRADAIHEGALATIREANAILSGDRGIKATVTECRALVELVSEEKYETVRDYHRRIDELQAKNQQGRK